MLNRNKEKGIALRNKPRYVWVSYKTRNSMGSQEFILHGYDHLSTDLFNYFSGAIIEEQNFNPDEQIVILSVAGF